MTSAEGPEEFTRKQRREAAREQRKALEAAHSAKAARQRRLLLLSLGLGVAVVIVVVAIVVSSGKSQSKGTGIVKSTAAQSTLVAQINTLIGGIPQSGTTLGDPSAPVTLDYYGDLECPICQEFSLQTLPTIITDLVRPGKLKIDYLSLETATQSPSVFQTQQVAALAAGQQGKGWEYIELFYHEQGQEDSGYVTEAYLDKLSAQVPGLNLTNWEAARNDASLANQVKSSEQAAAALSFNSTPTLEAVNTATGKRAAVAGFVPYSNIQSLVQSVS